METMTQSGTPACIIKAIKRTEDLVETREKRAHFEDLPVGERITNPLGWHES
jgi:hypothetical protein